MTKFYSHYDFNGPGTMIALLKREGMTRVLQPEDADIIVFNGGADIGTEIYNEIPAMRGIPRYKSERDQEEIDLFNNHLGDKFLLGICRGAQLLNCLNGGTLWQHVDNHGRDHQMVDLLTGHVYQTTSTHHQMMRPNLKTGKIIAVSHESNNKHAENVHRYIPINQKDDQDIEIVWYEDTMSLCIQGHPEYVPGSVFADYCIALVRNYMKASKQCAA